MHSFLVRVFKNHFSYRWNTNAARPRLSLLDGSVSSVGKFTALILVRVLRTISVIDGTLTQQGPEY